MARDLTVRLTDDRPGALSALVQTITRAGLNIDGLAEVEGTVHLIVSHATDARRILRSAGYELEDEREVVMITLPDRPGELAMVLRRLAEADVNVRFMYLAAGTRVVIGADDVVRARQVLAAYRPASPN
jgi:hypothetical protein